VYLFRLQDNNDVLKQLQCRIIILHLYLTHLALVDLAL